MNPRFGVWASGLLSGFCAGILAAAPDAVRAQVSSEFARSMPQTAASYTGERLSLNFQNIDVRAALKVIADFTQLNLVTSDSVSGAVTLRLQDVPWDQALDIILQTKGLGFRRSGSILMVAPREEWAARDQAELEVRRRIGELEALRTEAFQLHYSRADEVARGLLGSGIGAVQGAGAGSGSPPSAPPAGGAPPGAASPRLLSSRGSALAVARTNQLFETDIPAKLEQVRALIEKIDIPVKQVLIEARIVEAVDSFGRSLGVKLGFHDLRMQQGLPSGSAAGPRVVVGGNYAGVGTQTLQPGAPLDAPGSARETPSAAYANTQFVNLPAASLQGVDPATFAMSLFGASASRFLNLELSAMEADGRGKVVSSPRIVTTDQVEAHIKQGFRVPYRGNASGFGSAAQVQFQEANLKLTVTPQVTPQSHVILNVLVNKDSLGALTPDGREINTKEVRTKVLVENGGTVVMGGIYEHEEVGSGFKVPLLGDLPALGSFFRKTAREIRRTELLVFLTPTVIPDVQTPAR
ncbi:MAG: type IV pilus secretin PilQ [Burkholderiaceae bacterium]